MKSTQKFWSWFVGNLVHKWHYFWCSLHCTATSLSRHVCGVPCLLVSKMLFQVPYLWVGSVIALQSFNINFFPTLQWWSRWNWCRSLHCPRKNLSLVHPMLLLGFVFASWVSTSSIRRICWICPIDFLKYLRSFGFHSCELAIRHCCWCEGGGGRGQEALTGEKTGEFFFFFWA